MSLRFAFTSQLTKPTVLIPNFKGLVHTISTISGLHQLSQIIMTWYQNGAQTAQCNRNREKP